MSHKMSRNVEKRGVYTARNDPSPPPCVVKPEMSTADRLGSRRSRARPGLRRGGRELLRAWGDERDRSWGHSGAFPGTSLRPVQPTCPAHLGLVTLRVGQPRTVEGKRSRADADA